ncbi:hypothetical protein LQ567_08115 [Niabella pedocola]|uniref:ABC transporter permease n=1 Tax=Niabella pedocola TaxID=1752077 RepID=A0ABS8PNN3_9BACT|nr:hypothetical protein [Niabella pedocola]MCD2422722.1 hypothetical protein [Niabella pedocola]
MSPLFRIFYQSFVKPFYRENAGTFVFVFTMFFFVVGTVDGAGLFKYHYGLIKALLGIPAFLVIAILLWGFYARKCAVFITQLLQQPPYRFFSVFRNLPRRLQYTLFAITDFILLLPLTFYLVLVITEGFYLQRVTATIIVLILLVACGTLLPAWHVYVLNNPERSRFFLKGFKGPAANPMLFYSGILIRAVQQTQKLAWLGIKLYTCTVLYFTSANNQLAPDDLQLTFLLFSFGILANGVFINRLRRYEEQYLSFYRSLPVSVAKRFITYALYCWVLVLPELVLLFFLSGRYLNSRTAFFFGTYAFSAVLLLLGISFVKQVTVKPLAAILLLLFFTGYFIMMASGIGLISLVFFPGAVILFLTRYYRSEAIVS